MEELFDVREAADHLGLKPRTVRGYCIQGRLGRKVGSRWLISSADLERFAQEPRPVGRPRARVEGEVGE